ncbi:MAG: SAF domain-containing protein [Microthrixaceae bacterium]
MYGPTESEAQVLRIRRSLYVVAPVAEGEVFSGENVRSIRPANGLAPKHLDEVIGRRASRDLEFGEPLDWTMIQNGNYEVEGPPA